MENYWMMQFLNVTDVLTNRVNCSGSTFNLTLFWRVVRDLRALYAHCVGLLSIVLPQGCEAILINILQPMQDYK